jgi:recombination protein RecA
MPISDTPKAVSNGAAPNGAAPNGAAQSEPSPNGAKARTGASASVRDPGTAKAAADDQKALKARESALKSTLGQIDQQFGKGTVMRMGDEGARVRVEAIPTGALTLDIALGIGGVPRGRIVEVFGPESSGKTTLIYHVLAEAQKRGGVCAFIDAEHAMDPIYAKAIGVDIDELLVSQPDYGEQALEIADMLVRSGAIDVVAIDSVAALTPRAELEGEMGDQTVGLQARMMSQAMRKLAGNLHRTNTLCILTNQLREKVGVMFGSPETQPGGRALKFYASQRLDIRRVETLKDGAEAVGNRVRVKVVKNKLAPPFRQAELEIEFGKGISATGCLIDLGLERTVISKSGAFFSYGDERLGQGRANVKAYLEENPRIAQEIEAKIYASLGIGPEHVAPLRAPGGEQATPAATPASPAPVAAARAA